VFLKQLRKSKRPVVLTVKGRAAAIVQDAGAYQRLLDIAAQASAEEGIRPGLDDARKGRSRPAQEFFDEFESASGMAHGRDSTESKVVGARRLRAQPRCGHLPRDTPPESRASQSVPLLYRERVCRFQRNRTPQRVFQQLCSRFGC
jgi:hypothetical protein